MGGGDMGCTTSSLAGAQRSRRLSLNMETCVIEDEDEISVEHEPRGLVCYLSETILSGDELKREIAFGNARWKHVGDDVQNCDMPIGYACWRGLKTQTPNSDSWMFVQINQHCSLYGIFDGHGEDGYLISNYVKESLPVLILQDARFITDGMPAMLRDVFRQMQESIQKSDAQGKFNAQRSGTTATICVHDHLYQRLTIAHIGDGACALAEREQNDLVMKKLTTDHQPDLCSERKRIEQVGGSIQFDECVMNYRIYQEGKDYPGLNISRCFGDLLGRSQCGLSCEPDVHEVMLSERSEILCLCTDGVFEVMCPQEIGLHLKGYRSDTLMESARALAAESWEQWLQEEELDVVDDITVLLAYLPNAASEL